MLAPSVTRRLIGSFVTKVPPSPQKRAALATLTERELEVLRLIARHLSNAQIGETLIVGETTVKTPVARLLDKLELQNRV